MSMNKPPRRNCHRAAEGGDDANDDNTGKTSQKPNNDASSLDEYFTSGSMFRSTSCKDNSDASSLDEYFTRGSIFRSTSCKDNSDASSLDEYFSKESIFRSTSCKDNSDASSLDDYFSEESIFRSTSCTDNDDKRNNDVSTWATFNTMCDSVDDHHENAWLQLSEVGQKEVNQCTEEDNIEVNHRGIAYDKGQKARNRIHKTSRTPRSSKVIEQIALDGAPYNKSGHVQPCFISDTTDDSYQLNNFDSTFSRRTQTFPGHSSPLVIVSKEHNDFSDTEDFAVVKYEQEGNSPNSTQGKWSTFHPKGMREADKSNAKELPNRVSKLRKDKSTLYSDSGMRLSSSAENVSIRPGKLEHLGIQDSTNKGSSTGKLPQSDFETKGDQSWCKKMLKRWSNKLLEQKKPAYSFVKKFDLPHQYPGKPSSDMISAIAPTDDGNIWLGFRDSRAITLFNMTGNVLAVANLGAPVDDMTISRSGDLYISCPRAKCIKVIRAYDPDVVEVFVNLFDTPWWPRGLDIYPDEEAIVVCLALNFTAHSTVTHTNNCLMKFETRSRNHEGSLVTNEKCFGYPIKVSVSIENIIVVSDFGFQCITMLNDQGLVIAKFSEINETKISRRIALRFDQYGDVVIVQGKQPTLTVLKLDGSPFSFEDNNVSELLKCSVSVVAFDKWHRLLVGGLSGVIRIFKHN